MTSSRDWRVTPSIVRQPAGWSSCAGRRIVSIRQQFSDALTAHQVDMRLFPKLTSLSGMFALTGVTDQQVRHLRNEHHIYMLSNGRISVTGITTPILDRLAATIAYVVRA